MAEHQNPFVGGKKIAAKVGLNMRRTELQLGLPGSPQEEEEEHEQQGGEREQVEEKNEEHAGGFRKESPAAHSNHGEKGEISSAKSAQAAHQRFSQQQQQRSSSSSSSCQLKAPDLHDCVEKHVVEDTTQSRAPVGWPPVQSFRKNSLTAPPAGHQQSKTVDTSSNPSSPAAAAAPGPSSQHQAPGSQLVKVYMDGVPIGRKVNLRTHSSYDRLSSALEEMFRRFISGQSGTSKAVKDKLLNESKKFNFIYGSDYVLTYEDKDGDLMLVGDVPWGMFVGTVKRLRIMKGSDAIGLGAPRGTEDQLTAANK